MSIAVHPFDRYASLTDVAVLKEFSARPLRKCLRVNTLKISIEDFRDYAEKKKWQLTPVPWCPEAFFVERQVIARSNDSGIVATDKNFNDRPYYGEALGKDILHLTGHFYLQEAASMLPPALLDPQPGEMIFDMSAAPGSKTTQMAARMRGGGVIIANDVQEKRLWTLKSALYRLGITNAIVTKKVGQWFAGHMTERFDRVLCDAPCTAQGTVRKDSDALRYGGLESIAKMARLQTTLLESAVHAAKVGGRIVYSTCTLTPEENEGVVLSILNKFCDQIEVLDPHSLGIAPAGYWDPAIIDSQAVQESLTYAKSDQRPFIRLWPQTYDTEGFFCAVIRKKAPTRAPQALDTVPFQEIELPSGRMRDVAEQLVSAYGTSFLDDSDRLFQRSDQLLLSVRDVATASLTLEDYSLGLPFAKKLPDGRVILHQELITLRGMRATKNIMSLSSAEVEALLQGKDLSCDPVLRGHVILRYGDHAIGHGLAREGKMKNNLPRWMILR